ncbi:tRNA1(Val) (adenine(37)-N6)-methyltransferase [Ammoniphilus sp. CFH 90114]|uniref:tRNA1(Val) (adenine(37)-N6)-methyltransferase n=1 Tax=Ammoniphilus sp. CFH 90114 TaxID=2493665 RepID=UPI00100F3190|nr:tRNA1(Val) (adenine(37)-N6)-methyltransferase [Ammoniphilus sp. CFH 90114]RXT08988.1 tRNA1(Val) (adenine(37)-N6)-methyltransferase [Ammoniphilus sp. CFH 90114]
MEIALHPSERVDDLLTHDRKIIQSHEVFSFSMDAVLLARFASLPIQKGRIMDLCTGNGVIPLLLSTRSKAKIEGLEIQERLHDMASRNVVLNQLEDQIKIYLGDLKEAPQRFGHGVYDVVTCNPPYMLPKTGEVNQNEHFAIARHEIYCTLEDVIRVSAYLVRSGGKVAFVHRPSRLIDMIELMRKYRVEPKRIRFVHPKAGAEANMVLIEGIRDGKPDLKLLPPLIVYDDDGSYCPELLEIYYGERGE